MVTSPIQIASGSVNVDGGVSLTISPPIQDGSSPTALAKVGGGSLTLLGQCTYSGATTVNGGVLATGNVTGTVLSPNSAVSVGNQSHGRHAQRLGHSLSANGPVADDRFAGHVQREPSGYPLASLGNVTFASGSTIDIFGSIIRPRNADFLQRLGIGPCSPMFTTLSVSPPRCPPAI